MHKIEYKEIKKADKDKVLNLMQVVIDDIEKPEWYIKDTQEDIARMFEKDFVYNYGAYDKERLIGMTQLYLDQEDLKSYKNLFDLENSIVCVLGTALVLKEYRNQGIMQELIRLQRNVAENLKFEYMLSIAHPDNIASVTAIMKSGFSLKGKSILYGKYLRNLFEMKL